MMLMSPRGPAQEIEKSLPSSFSINSVSLKTSWYNPSMNYWNQSFLPSAGSSEQFNGGVLFEGNISFNLPLNFGALVGAWYWQENVSGLPDATFNNLRIGFLGFSLGVFYQYPKPILTMYPYLGIRASYFIIQNHYDVSGNILKMSGYDINTMPFIGVEHVFFKKMIVGLEYGYTFGRYRQIVTNLDGTTDPIVLVNGHQVGLKIGFKFPKH